MPPLSAFTSRNCERALSVPHSFSQSACMIIILITIKFIFQCSVWPATVVEYLPQHLKVEGSRPTNWTEQGKRKFRIMSSPGRAKSKDRESCFCLSFQLLLQSNINEAFRRITVLYRVYCAYEYSAHLNLQWFLAKKKYFYLSRIHHCKFIHHKSHLIPFLSYLPCIVCREYFSIIFNVKKCAICPIKYDNS